MMSTEFNLPQFILVLTSNAGGPMFTVNRCLCYTEGGRLDSYPCRSLWHKTWTFWTHELEYSYTYYTGNNNFSRLSTNCFMSFLSHYSTPGPIKNCQAGSSFPGTTGRVSITAYVKVIQTPLFGINIESWCCLTSCPSFPRR